MLPKERRKEIESEIDKLFAADAETDDYDNFTMSLPDEEFDHATYYALKLLTPDEDETPVFA